MTENDIRQIAESILNLVASQDERSNWWGHDTDCGNATDEAVAILKDKFLYQLRDGTYTGDVGRFAKQYLGEE